MNVEEAITQELLYAREWCLRVVAIHVTPEALRGSPVVLPLHQTRVYVLALAGVLPDGWLDYHQLRELLVHPEDWKALAKIYLPKPLVDMDFESSRYRVFGIQVLAD